jgi:hypothetical protein
MVRAHYRPPFFFSENTSFFGDFNILLSPISTSSRVHEIARFAVAARLSMGRCMGRNPETVSDASIIGGETARKDCNASIAPPRSLSVRCV